MEGQNKGGKSKMRFEVVYGNTYAEALKAEAVFVTYEQFLKLSEQCQFVIITDDDENEAAFEEAKQEYLQNKEVK